jgi:hypothetical protein
MSELEKVNALCTERQTILQRLSLSMEESKRLMEKNKQIMSKSASLQKKAAYQLNHTFHF